MLGGFTWLVGKTGHHRINRALDIRRAHLVGLDKLQRQLRIRFIGLHTIGQAHGIESGLIALLAQRFDRHLAQPATGGGIHAAADPQYQRPRSRTAQRILDKTDTALNFLLYICGRLKVGIHLQCAANLSATACCSVHACLLSSGYGRTD